jgi:hypothetical protein
LGDFILLGSNSSEDLEIIVRVLEKVIIIHASQLLNRFNYKFKCENNERIRN